MTVNFVIYTNDIVLLETSRDRMQKMTEAVETEGRKAVLLMNVNKCKTVVSNTWKDCK